MSIEIKTEGKDKILYLFGEYEASWSAKADDMAVIVPYAIERAKEIGKREAKAEIRKLLDIRH